ncbi:serine/threonine-protein kinase ATM isoform X1 [Vigna unguiculata]|uniref:serine/threonine-protein kinase ATM isoform X1 n=1 Tax=Vigna unguiculata TaxID=3917 RepID=UPI0010160DCF|nr:serine/threonine-protein kinase ATM isoform X1 [Vigna unguiculata]XP_027932210.1 serine/threonine-protein kinase ATM isoform X1 [Vigna unguiculata]XP_027932211.1 serine/threonine-protein kinase ATM isoform X1 [Vigna unguiculata]XP_027932212.1 serine/threonine-protein kinase ATM isoform X1 [Vigna unguiculata]
MDMVLTLGRADTDVSEETKGTGNTIMHEETQRKLGGSGFDSRDRRKSKYLSYPYTNLRSKQNDLCAETENLKTQCPSRKRGASSFATSPANISSLNAKLGSKRFRKNWYRKFISCNNLSSSPEFMNASMVDVLSGLFSTAVDCMFPVGKESFGLVEQFFCRYRISNYCDEAELATLQVNAQELGKPVGNDLPDTVSKKRKNNKRESAVRRKRKSLSGLSDVNASTSTFDSQMPGKKMKQKRKMEEATLGQQLQNVKTNLIGGSSKYSSTPQTSPNLSCLASEGKTVYKRRKKIKAQENESAQITSVCTDAKKLKCSSLVVDLQFTSPPVPVDIPQRNKSGNKEELLFISTNPGSCVSQKGPIGRINDNSLSVITKAEADTVLVSKTALNNSMEKAAGAGVPHNSLGKAAEANPNTELAVEQTGLNNSMEKAAEKPLNTKLALGEPRQMDSTEMAAEKLLNTKFVVEIPDLNCSGAECNSISTEFDTVNFTSNELKPEKSSLPACSRPIKTAINRRRKDGCESLGNCLLLQFAPVAYIPSKEDLMTTFYRFGPLKTSETQLLKDIGSAQVVFVRSKDAAAAFHSLEQNKFAFGSTLVDYKLHRSSAPCPPVEQLVIPAQPTGFMAMPGLTPTQPTGSMAMPGLTPAQPTGSVAMPGVNPAQPTGSKAIPCLTPTQPTGSMAMPGETPTQPILSMARLGVTPNQPTMAVAMPGVTPNQPTMAVAVPGVTPTQQTGFTLPMLGETPPSLQDMKQGLQMMESVLENSGGSLSPQMRAKLDSAIKNLMRKVNSVT